MNSNFKEKLEKLKLEWFEEDGFGVSAESENTYVLLDFYGEQEGYPYLSEELQKVMNDCGLCYEWINPKRILIRKN